MFVVLKKKLNLCEFLVFIKYDIIGFPETKTDDADSIQIAGYTLFMKNRRTITKVRSGGIILAVKDTVVGMRKI